MPTPDELRTLIDRYVAAVNSRDATTVAALFAQDAVQADPASNPPNLGRDAIRTFFGAGIDGSESWTFAAKAVHTCADHVAIDFEIAVQAGGATMVIDGVEIFVVDDEGLIASLHAYWDESDVTVS